LSVGEELKQEDLLVAYEALELTLSLSDPTVAPELTGKFFLVVH
jgi:hypothetical protein